MDGGSVALLAETTLSTLPLELYEDEDDSSSLAALGMSLSESESSNSGLNISKWLGSSLESLLEPRMILTLFPLSNEEKLLGPEGRLCLAKRG